MKKKSVALIGHVDHGKHTLSHVMSLLNQGGISVEREYEITGSMQLEPPDLSCLDLGEKKGRRRSQRKQRRGW